MTKRRTKQLVKPSFTVSVHSSESPHILMAICKDVHKDEAIDMVHKLSALSSAPYMARVIDHELNEVYFYKKSK